MKHIERTFLTLDLLLPQNLVSVRDCNLRNKFQQIELTVSSNTEIKSSNAEIFFNARDIDDLVFVDNQSADLSKQ
eukprot:snap_masked-scaffold_21-processed-gene-4.35-mRNA-1 protein AED:1.00 eAED:1.00 QI:0/-1/0/0/-1/1/1/0/74